jgi:hypothetical protein
MLSVKVTPSANKVTNSLADAVADRVRLISDDLFRTIKRRTPVKSGRAKKGWKQSRESKMRYSISNRVPYINRLDNGYSKQAPNGIVRPAVTEVARRTKSRRK